MRTCVANVAELMDEFVKTKLRSTLPLSLTALTADWLSENNDKNTKMHSNRVPDMAVTTITCINECC